MSQMFVSHQAADGVYKSDDFIYKHYASTDFTHTETHSHDICELLFVKKGDITYFVDGKSYQVTKNTLIISRPLKMHAIVANSYSVYDRHDILFDPNHHNAFLYGQIPKNIDVINFSGNELVCGLFKKMDYYCQNCEGEMLKDFLVHLTNEVLFHVLQAARNLEQSDICTVNPVIAQAIGYIDDHITSQLQIETICKELFITKSHLHHLFTTHLNTTPQKYIMFKKLHMAQMELQAGASPTDVCSRYGFSNYSTFYRNYVQCFGINPANGSNKKPEHVIY